MVYSLVSLHGWITFVETIHLRSVKLCHFIVSDLSFSEHKHFRSVLVHSLTIVLCRFKLLETPLVPRRSIVLNSLAAAWAFHFNYNFFPFTGRVFGGVDVIDYFVTHFFTRGKFRRQSFQSKKANATTWGFQLKVELLWGNMQLQPNQGFVCKRLLK